MYTKKAIGAAALSLMFLAGVANAQATSPGYPPAQNGTTSPGGMTNYPSGQVAPGAPNTGEGGNAQATAVMLGISGAVAAAGAYLLSRKRNLQ